MVLMEKKQLLFNSIISFLEVCRGPGIPMMMPVPALQVLGPNPQYQTKQNNKRIM